MKSVFGSKVRKLTSWDLAEMIRGEGHKAEYFENKLHVRTSSAPLTSQAGHCECLETQMTERLGFAEGGSSFLALLVLRQSQRTVSDLTCLVTEFLREDSAQ